MVPDLNAYRCIGLVFKTIKLLDVTIFVYKQLPTVLYYLFTLLSVYG